jgi:hypothetical protein
MAQEVIALAHAALELHQHPPRLVLARRARKAPTRAFTSITGWTGRSSALTLPTR